MNNELERISKGAVVAEEWNYPSIFSERPRKTKKSSASQPILQQITYRIGVNSVTAGLTSCVSMSISNYKREIINTGESICLKFLKECTNIYTGTLKKSAIDFAISSRLDPLTS
jgi:hypothetical protein